MWDRTKNTSFGIGRASTYTVVVKHWDNDGDGGKGDDGDGDGDDNDNDFICIRTISKHIVNKHFHTYKIPCYFICTATPCIISIFQT